MKKKRKEKKEKKNVRFLLDEAGEKPLAYNLLT